MQLFVCARVCELGSTDVLRAREKDTNQSDSNHIKKEHPIFFVFVKRKLVDKKNPNLMQMHVKYGLFSSWK